MGWSGQPTTPPRLRYDALPSLPRKHSLQPAGLVTPPLRPPGAVPFEWEEVPGKPKPLFGFSMSERKPAASGNATWRCLHDVDFRSSSPTAVLDGPYHVVLPLVDGAGVYDGRPPVVRSSSFGVERSAGWRKEGLVWLRRKGSVKGGNGGGRRRSTPAAVSHGEDGFGCAGYAAGRHSCFGDESGRSVGYYIREVVLDGDGGGGQGAEEEEEKTKVKLTRLRTKRRLSTLSSATAHLWGSIFGGLKQVVVMAPWRKETQKASAVGTRDLAITSMTRTTLRTFLI